nr:immunoglobulin light chain junction region [Macaca mulatta]
WQVYDSSAHVLF